MACVPLEPRPLAACHVAVNWCTSRRVPRLGAPTSLRCFVHLAQRAVCYNFIQCSESHDRVMLARACGVPSRTARTAVRHLGCEGWRGRAAAQSAANTAVYLPWHSVTRDTYVSPVRQKLCTAAAAYTVLWPHDMGRKLHPQKAKASSAMHRNICCIPSVSIASNIRIALYVCG